MSPHPTAGALRESASPEVERFARELDLSTTVAEWLWQSGHRDPKVTRRFLEPKLSGLTQPDAMADLSRAAERLASAIRQGERVCVFGDYDCDGITSTAIMTEAIRALGGHAAPLLASRFAGGYGVSESAAERILATEARVLVTCDCGSSDHDVLGSLAARGLDIIVIDHHLVPDRALPVHAFLNPHRPECGFPYKGLASCGLALVVAAALRRELGAALDVRQWLDLVAVGTIADVAPLDGDNRMLVRAGLERLSRAPRPGLAVLLGHAKLAGTGEFTGRDVAFRIAPRINAPGRIGAPDAALQLLLCRTTDEAELLGAELETLSALRRQEQERIVEEALEVIAVVGLETRPAIVVGREGWGHGIVGIVAGRLADRFERPVIVIGFDGGVGRGSVRGPKGVRLHDALSRVAPLLRRFGGHQAAAGLEVEQDRLGALRDAFEAAVAEQDGRRVPAPSEDAVVTLATDDALVRVVRDLYRLEPCGEANPRPRVRVSARVLRARQVKGGHLKLELLLPNGAELGCFAVGMGERAPAMIGNVEVVGDLRLDRYRGGEAVELLADRLAPEDGS